MCVYIDEGTYMPWHACGGQRTTWGSWVFFFPSWGLISGTQFVRKYLCPLSHLDDPLNGYRTSWVHQLVPVPLSLRPLWGVRWPGGARSFCLLDMWDPLLSAPWGQYPKHGCLCHMEWQQGHWRLYWGHVGVQMRGLAWAVGRLEFLLSRTF